MENHCIRKDMNEDKEEEEASPTVCSKVIGAYKDGTCKMKKILSSRQHNVIANSITRDRIIVGMEATKVWSERSSAI